MTELTDTERETIEQANYDAEGRGLGPNHPLFTAVEAILTARLARIEALAEDWEARAEKATREGLGPQTIGATFAVRSLRAAVAAPTPTEVQP